MRYQLEIYEVISKDEKERAFNEVRFNIRTLKMIYIVFGQKSSHIISLMCHIGIPKAIAWASMYPPVIHPTDQ